MPLHVLLRPAGIVGVRHQVDHMTYKIIISIFGATECRLAKKYFDRNGRMKLGEIKLTSENIIYVGAYSDESVTH